MEFGAIAIAIIKERICSRYDFVVSQAYISFKDFAGRQLLIQGMVYVFSEPVYQDIILPHMIQKLGLDDNKLDCKSSEVRLHVLLFARSFPLPSLQGPQAYF